MNSPQLEQIQQRRAILVARADVQRLDLALNAQAWQKPLALVDRGIALLRRVRKHPATLLLGLVALAFLNRKRPGRLLYFGGMAWRAWRAQSNTKPKSL